MTSVPETEDDFVRALAELEGEINRARDGERAACRRYDASVDGSIEKQDAMDELRRWADGRRLVEARIDDLCDFAEGKGWM